MYSKTQTIYFHWYFLTYPNCSRTFTGNIKPFHLHASIFSFITYICKRTKIYLPFCIHQYIKDTHNFYVSLLSNTSKLFTSLYCCLSTCPNFCLISYVTVSKTCCVVCLYLALCGGLSFAKSCPHQSQSEKILSLKNYS